MTESVDWSERYASGETPWDLGGPHPELVARLGSDLSPFGSGRALVPGCGRGHDAAAIADGGWDVTAIDLVPDLAALVTPRLGDGRFLVDDALEHVDEAGYDLMFDHTFLCALPPERRPDWARLVDRVIRPEGRVALLVFPIGRPHDQGGPPWGLSAEDVVELLAETFVTERLEPPGRPIVERSWPERWLVLRRR